MKKRIVAALLSAALCCSTVMEVSAAAVDFQAEEVQSVEFAAEETAEETTAEETTEVAAEAVSEESGSDVVPEVITDVESEVTVDTQQAAPEVDASAVQEESGETQTEPFITEEAPAAELFGDGVSVPEENVNVQQTEEAPLGENEFAWTDWERTEDGRYRLKKKTAEGQQTDASVISEVYYTDADGIVEITTRTETGISYTGKYLFDAEGFMVTGTSGEYYFDGAEDITDSSGYPLVAAGESAESLGLTPWNSKLGQLRTNAWRWEHATGTFHYYGTDGVAVSIPALDEQYKAEGRYTGYFEINGEYYCLDSNGAPRTGSINLTVGGTTNSYYFQETKDSTGISGKMFHNGWICRPTSRGERWLYYDLGVSNPANIGKLYKHGTIITQLDTAVKGSSTYLINKYGYLLKSTMRKAENGNYYFSDSKGRIYKNRMVTYKGSKYYVGKYGNRVTWKNSWHRCSGAGNRMYYFGSIPGKVVKKTGWQKVTVKGRFYGWFYFSKSGKHYANKLTKSGYYFKENGKLASGPVQIGKRMYFFEKSTSTSRAGKMVKGKIVNYGSDWYYASKTGVLRKTGWQTTNGNTYYFKNYKAVRNTFVKRNDVYGYLDNTGRFTTGWVIENDKKNLVRYVNPKKKEFVKNTSMVINGLRYYFDKDGYRINDLTDRFSGPYSLVVDRVNGVVTVYNSDRTIPLRSMRVSVGKAETPSPTGTFYLSRSARWQPLMGNSWGQYGTLVTGNVLFHSVPSGSPDPYALPAGEYNLLGSPASHGCLRLCVADAKWIYENCNGARTTIMDGTYQEEEVFKGPLGRKPLTGLVAPYTYDPTDPALPENK